MLKIIWSGVLWSDVHSRLCGKLWSRLVRNGVVCTEPHSKQHFLTSDGFYLSLFYHLTRILTKTKCFYLWSDHNTL